MYILSFCLTASPRFCYLQLITTNSGCYHRRRLKGGEIAAHTRMLVRQDAVFLDDSNDALKAIITDSGHSSAPDYADLKAVPSAPNTVRLTMDYLKLEREKKMKRKRAQDEDGRMKRMKLA